MGLAGSEASTQRSSGDRRQQDSSRDSAGLAELGLSLQLRKAAADAGPEDESGRGTAAGGAGLPSSACCSGGQQSRRVVSASLPLTGCLYCTQVFSHRARSPAAACLLLLWCRWRMGAPGFRLLDQRRRKLRFRL